MDDIIKKIDIIYHIKNDIKKIVRLVSMSLISKIEFRKFNSADSTTNISNDTFYAKYDGLYFLTNGSNKSISSSGGGTTGAIGGISESLFIHSEFTMIHDSSPFIVKNPIINDSDSDSSQQSNSSEGKVNNKPAGCVFYIEKNIVESKKHIGGVYHINGIRWGGQSDDVKNLTIPLICSYYSSIIQHFVSKSEQSKLHIIHLAQIPGFLYNGGDETYVGLLIAFLNNADIINPANVMFIIDMESKKCNELLSGDKYNNYFIELVK